MMKEQHFRTLPGVVTCPDGYENKGGGSSLDCVACPCGLFSRNGAACANCHGWRASSDGVNCDICAAGYEKKGMYPAGPLCVRCAGGFYSSNGYGACQSCPANTYSTYGSYCDTCAPGFENVGTGSVPVCSACRCVLSDVELLTSVKTVPVGELGVCKRVTLQHCL